jgi:hypothetical protein
VRTRPDASAPGPTDKHRAEQENEG